MIKKIFSLLGEDRLDNNRKVIPFESIIDHNFNSICDTDDYYCKFDFQVVRNESDIKELPKYHHKMSNISINYDKYILIYVSIGGDNLRGCKIKIDQVLQCGEDIIITIKKLTPKKKNSFSFEVIDVPYDVIKISKDKLLKSGRLNFKFIDSHDKLLYSESLIIK